MILVTGAAGFIGSNFLHYIHKKTDDEIVIVDNLTYASDIKFIDKLIDNKRVKFIEIDIADEQAVDELFVSYKPNIVFHFAAESHVDNSIRNYRPFIQANILGTINLLNASRDVVDKFHHISTDEVFGSLEYDDPNIFTEETLYNPRNPYSASKAASDYFVKAWHNTYGVPYLITNCSNNYGPRQHPEKLIPLTITNAINDRMTYMHGGGNQIRDWLYVKDHCEAIWMLYEQGIMNDTFNIGGSCEKKNIDVVKDILDILGKSHDLIGVTADRPGHDKRYAMDHSKLTNAIGWKPGDKWLENINSTIQWYLSRYYTTINVPL
jgi:dTDP-glucose 4,6-dehydratase